MSTISTYLARYKGLFVGRDDDYAVQLPSGRYRRVGKPLTDTALHDHLLGTRSYGTYVMDAAGQCRFAVIDADGEDGLARLWSIKAKLAASGISSYMECSRRGGHLWIFFTRVFPASEVRAWLRPYCPTDLEFYPKQDEGKNGYGSLIRLPLGVHRRSGLCYPFVEHDGAGHLIPLTVTVQDCLTWFASIIRMEVPQPARRAESRKAHTQQSLSSSLSPGTTRGLSPIRQWNEAQDPFVVIGRYVSLNSAGVGQCPFGNHHTGSKDTKPSFKVYVPKAPGGYCWYCYTWQKGGSVFDFLRYYFGLDAQDMWERIQSDEVEALPIEQNRL